MQAARGKHQTFIHKITFPLTEWTHDEITAQAVAFMIAGFGTPSSLLCFMAYELARHPEAQAKLHEEIDEVYAKTNGKPSYSDLSNMKYIDMVISGI